MMRKSLDLLYKLSGAGAALSLLVIVLILFGQVTFNMIDYVAHALFNQRFGLLIPSCLQRWVTLKCFSQIVSNSRCSSSMPSNIF